MAKRKTATRRKTAGKKAVGYFKFKRIEVARAHTLSDEPGYDEIEQLADRYIADFVEGRLDAVRVASLYYISTGNQIARVVQLLPLVPTVRETGGTPRAEALYEFKPSVDEILNELMPMAVRTLLHQAFLEAAVSEQIMRMVAMKAATDNARDLGRGLTRRFNRARQTQITTELMEVIAGAAALD